MPYYLNSCATMKTNLCNPLFFLVLALFMLVSANLLGKDYIQKEQYPFNTTKISNTKSTKIVECSYGGEYSVNYFSSAGRYIINSNRTCYLTLTDEFDSIIATGKKYLIITVSKPGKYRIHLLGLKTATIDEDGTCHQLRVAPFLEKPKHGKGLNDFVSMSSIYNLFIQDQQIHYQSKNHITKEKLDFCSMLVDNKKIKQVIEKRNAFVLFNNFAETVSSILSSSHFSLASKRKLKGKLHDPFSLTGRVTNIVAFLLARKSNNLVTQINTTNKYDIEIH